MNRVLCIAAIALLAITAQAQVPYPQIPLTGTPGAAGNFPFLPNGLFSMPSDADYTVGYPNTTCVICIVRSSVSLTATRRVVEPAQKMTFNFTNLTTGGQSVTVIASSGSGVTIANGASAWIYFNGTNYVPIDPPSGGVSRFNTRVGDVVLNSTDVNSVGTISNDTTGNSSSATTASQINGGAVPANATVLGTNGSSQLISAAASSIGTLLQSLPNCTIGGYAFNPALNNCQTYAGSGGAQIDVTSSRAFNSVFQNTNSYAIWVSGFGTVNGSSGDSTIGCWNGPVSGSNNVWATTNTSTGSGKPTGFAFRVPAGWFYQCLTTGNINPLTTAGKWFENPTS